MEIQVFAEMTYRVLKDTPLEEFLPTLCLPEQRHVAALEGVPETKEEGIREIALRWAESKAKEGEEFLLAFRDGPGFFRVIRRADGELHEALFPGRKPAQPVGMRRRSEDE